MALPRLSSFVSASSEIPFSAMFSEDGLLEIRTCDGLVSGLEGGVSVLEKKQRRGGIRVPSPGIFATMMAELFGRILKLERKVRVAWRM